MYPPPKKKKIVPPECILHTQRNDAEELKKYVHLNHKVCPHTLPFMSTYFHIYVHILWKAKNRNDYQSFPSPQKLRFGARAGPDS